MRRRLALDAKIIDGANQSGAEMMLPNTIHDDSGHERARAVIEVGHPFGHRAPLLGGVRPAPLASRQCPVILGCFAAREHREKPQLNRFAPSPEIAAGQQEGLTWFNAKVSKAERRGERFWLMR